MPLNFRYKELMYLPITMVALVISCTLKNDPEFPVKEWEGAVAAGCPDANYGDWQTSEYVLPYPVGTTYKSNLTNCAGFFHGEASSDRFAIDFEMFTGSLITATRAGKVVFIEESGIDGAFPNNLVVVEHDDGTFAQYMHLTREGALVTYGDVVKQGDSIGLSGSTGLAGYPHLHFVVTKAGSYEHPYESVPVTFSNTYPNERSLLAYTEYPACAY